MRKIDIHDAKTHLSRLVDEAADGKPFIIARAGKPMVNVLAIDASASSESKASRLGFMRGEIEVPDDFDRMGEREIEERFHGPS